MNNISYTLIGALVGIGLLLLIYITGWYALWAIPFGLIGAAIGAHFDGRIDLTAPSTRLNTLRKLSAIQTRRRLQVLPVTRLGSLNTS